MNNIDLMTPSKRLAPFRVQARQKPLAVRLAQYLVLSLILVNLIMVTALSFARQSELEHNIAFARAFQPVK